MPSSLAVEISTDHSTEGTVPKASTLVLKHGMGMNWRHIHAFTSPLSSRNSTELVSTLLRGLHDSTSWTPMNWHVLL